MRKFYVTLAVVLCTMTGWGCQSNTAMQHLEYAAVEAQHTDTLLLRMNENCHQNKKQQEVDENLPKITIDIHFVGGSLTDLRQQGLVGGDNVQIVSQEHADRLLSWAQNALTSKLISAPRLIAYSGCRASFMHDTRMYFVQDFKLKTNQKGQLVPEPVIGQYSQGRMIDVQATLDGDEIVFKHIAPKIQHIMAIRNCRANVATETSKTPLSWQEPYLVVGTASLNEGVQVRVNQGQIVLLPLRYRVVQDAAVNARALASDGKVDEVYRNMIPVSDSEPSPLNRQVVVMLKASVVEKPTG